MDEALADLAWWFGFGHFELENMTICDVKRWIAQASRQIKAGYQKTAF
ncbi:GpE family phage tail protein [Moraxella lacunata]